MPALTARPKSRKMKMCLVLSRLVGILANTPGGVKRSGSGLGAHAVGLLVVY